MRALHVLFASISLGTSIAAGLVVSCGDDPEGAPPANDAGSTADSNVTPPDPNDGGGAVFRYSVDGLPDATWGPSGRRLFTKSIGIDAARAIRVLPDGKLLVGGRMFTSTGASDLALARIVP